LWGPPPLLERGAAGKTRFDARGKLPPGMHEKLIQEGEKLEEIIKASLT
jgi:hypothetical protein